jgi:hypothetical protein
VTLYLPAQPFFALVLQSFEGAKPLLQVVDGVLSAVTLALGVVESGGRGLETLVPASLTVKRELDFLFRLSQVLGAGCPARCRLPRLL